MRRRRRRRRFTASLAGSMLALLVAAGRLTASAAPETTTSTVLSGTSRPVPSSWHLAFHDEFNGSRLARTRWSDCHWWAIDGGCTIASNHELEWYQPGNVSVANGRLRLQARKEHVTVPNGGPTYDYTSGMVASGPAYGVDGRPVKYAFTYGYVEARLHIPSDTGMWPAFWLLPADEESKPEVDILETINDDTTAARFHLHYLDGNGEHSLGHTFTGPDLGQGWHRVALDWRPGTLTWIVDGRARWQVRGDAVPTEAMYLVLNLAVGGDYPGPPDAGTAFPATLKADWIRVYQP